MTCWPELTQVVLTAPQIETLLRALADMLRAVALMLGAALPLLGLVSAPEPACPPPDSEVVRTILTTLPAEDAAAVRAYLDATTRGGLTL
jgi:hypothetical protein